MSELKLFNSERIYWAVEQVERVAGDIDELHLDDSDFYLKSEADKVIAELLERIDEERSAKVDWKISANDLKCGLKEAYCEIDHQKYKRCLNMAKRCFTKSNYHFVLARHGEDGKENNRRSILYSKWHKRWLELAERFKPNKEYEKFKEV